MTVLIGMFLLGLFIAFGSWVVSWSNHVKKELVVHVYYCTNDTCAKEATAKQMNQVARLASGSALVKRVDFVSKQQALAQMKQEASGRGRRSCRRTRSRTRSRSCRSRATTSTKVAALFQRRRRHGIEKVDYGKKTTHKVLRLAHVIEAFFVDCGVCCCSPPRRC